MPKSTFKISSLEIPEIDFPEAEKAPVPSFLEHNVIVRGFTLSDLIQSGDFVVGRLQKKYPKVSEKALFAYLKDIIFSNEHQFLRTDCAFAAARLRKDTFMPMWAEELFVFSEPGHEGEGIDLYRGLVNWAKGHSVTEFYCDVMSDIPIDLMRAHFGKLTTFQQSSFRVDAN